MSVQIIDARGFSLRHIAPSATWPSEGSTTTLLGRSYGYTVLPMSHLPTSPDLTEGSYTGRLGDSGEFTLSFPNVAGSKGLWRERFSADLSLEFVEIYRDDVLEFVGSIQRVEIDRGVVTVSGTDAWALLRRAYEQDRSWTAAPQEIIAAYTRVPVAVIADDFDGSSLAGNWSIYGSGSSATVDGGQVKLTLISGQNAGIYDATTGLTSDTWRMSAQVVRVVPASAAVASVEIHVLNAAGTRVYGSLYYGQAPNRGELQTHDGTNTHIVSISMPVEPEDQGAATLQLERNGHWVTGYINGRAVGTLPCPSDGTQDRVDVRCFAGISGPAMDVYVDSVIVTELQPFLARGSDVGDYVLPSDQPHGGLRGRYFNNADLQGLAAAARVHRPLAPDRAHYAERLDATIDTAAISIPVKPGNSGEFFAVRWFGSVYLRGDLGDYTFETTSVDDGCRLWVGKTGWGDALLDFWTAGGTHSATWTAADFGAKAGWYPIVLEYYNDQGAAAITLKFTPPATGYTDPGGTTITASTKITIPSSSLSPLGCYDNRVQGTSHFDLAQGAAQQFGYQLWCEPMQLESGEFPGRLVPRLRVGRDTDKVLEVEDREGIEPALSPGLTLDGSDQAVTLIGAGAGLADGKGSQVSAEINDITNLAAALFNLQANVDAADIAFPDLLAARLSAELALRATPWEEVRATPRAQEQLADTWPLSQTLSAMRWRPGDGLRLRVPDIGVDDTAPRQMLQVTRAFAAEGRTGTQVAFRQRPRSAARSVRGLLRAAISSSRSYQGRVIPLSGDYLTATQTAGSWSAYSIIGLLSGDRVVRATIRILQNSAAMSLRIEINGTDVTTALGGPWATAPVEVDVTAYATQASATDNRMYARVQNNGASSSNVDASFAVEVLR